MRQLVMLLARFAVFMALRERQRDMHHGLDPRSCRCESCQWVRGIEAEADAAFGQEWRP